MKTICFVTGTRADYGILAPVMREVAKSKDVNLLVAATNMHLSEKYGMTVTEIEKDGFTVEKIKSLDEGGDAAAAVRSMAKVEEGLAELFKRKRPDLVVILGDRYEALAAAATAVTFNIPVAHLHGGEVTEGAIDNRFRNAITKLSTYHFAATPLYAERIKGMGENPENIFHSGAPGAEVIEEEDASVAQEFFEKTGLGPQNPFILLAFHPVTLADDNGAKELNATLAALDTFINQGYKVLMTMPNSDPGTSEISSMLTDWAKSHAMEVVAVKSLGSKLFHHALDTAAAMIGNSSAALIEAPSHRLGAVNVGTRQKGRAHGMTVISAPADKTRIEEALKAVLSLEMKAVLMGMSVGALNPYYKENAAEFIADHLIRKCL